MTASYVLQELAAIARFVGAAFVHILPYLAISIPLAVALKRSGVASTIRRGLSARPATAVLVATLVGAVSPFCSCGVVPVIAALLLGGVPIAPVMAFWLASPSMDPEIFVLSVGAIGWELAVWRLIATFAMSLGGGLLVLALERRGWLGRDVLRPAILGTTRLTPPSLPQAGAFGLPALALAPCCAGAPPALARDTVPSQPTVAPGTCGCSSAAPTAATLPAAGRSSAAGQPPGPDRRSLLEDTLRTTFGLSAYMAVAFVLEALLIRHVPHDLVAAHLGGGSPWSVPLAVLIGVPMYTTNLTALGLVSGLLQQGMSPAAALAFLIGGAVTTLPAMSAVWGIVRPRVFALYLGLSIAGALLAGLAYDLAHAL